MEIIINGQPERIYCYATKSVVEYADNLTLLCVRFWTSSLAVELRFPSADFHPQVVRVAPIELVPYADDDTTVFLKNGHQHPASLQIRLLNDTQLGVVAQARTTAAVAAQAEAVGTLKSAHAEGMAALESTKKELAIAQDAAGLTLKEALSKFMRFAPEGMKPDTQARIAKAVQSYIIDPEKHSLKAVAKEFGITKKTVSLWFSRFSEETGFKVVNHVRHESVRSQAVTTAAQAGSGKARKTSVR
jgi:hypothetical protein